MSQPVKRRYSSILRAKQLLSGIAFIRQQKQIPNLKRISSYMLREHDVHEPEVQKQLNLAVKDGLIIHYTAIGSKGSKTGVEQEGYKIPQVDDSELDDGHDWYCFECHQGGEMYECQDCWRVFHEACLPEDSDNQLGSKFSCYICQAGRAKNKLKRKMLNTLLSYTVLRLKEKTRELHRIALKEPDTEMMFERFVYKNMDLNMMEEKVSNHKYKCLEEFQADAQTVLHAVFVVYGEEKGGITELARIMVKDCKYDLEEIRHCHRCYYLSNAKPQHWFCQPCDPPHELVYAKQKGYSYWPAKIIQHYGDKCDVRFFGAFHQRAVIPTEYIRPINANLKTMSIKKTTGFTKSMKELQLHQQLVEEIASKASDSDKASSKDESSDGDEEDEPEVEEEETMEVEEEGETDKQQVTSTSVQPPRKKRKVSKAASPESSIIVTSSEDKIAHSPPVPTSTIACQTLKIKEHSRASQTDESQFKDKAEVTSCDSKLCNCKENQSALEELRKNLLKEHSSEKSEALQELSEKLLKSFEEDKQQAVSRTMANTKAEIERVKKQAEEKCKEKYMEEMKKLAQKHKDSISQTKKKQWCFNCEEEAMYHCCWNTSYCSVKCQQEHWHKEHKRICRRKR
ncbi:zinc finger MYND domain-containing protein 11 [Patella vulgata]|uniref:zinc finger MYND domain-containing protein 11 n=1 Tax=Patella vulgata TaxID=6465 RepID=UPI00217F93C4|nr:zinc finger MYND domain-containing protein 11 [Patella vulgata]